MIVEGYFRTKNLKKYVCRLLLFAVLSEIPFNLAMGSSWFYPIHQNVLLCFLIAIGLIHWNEKVKKKNKLWKRIAVGIITVILGYFLGLVTMTDFYQAGVLTVLVFYFFRERKWWGYVGQLLCLWYINVEMLGGFGYEISLGGETFFLARQGFALLALIPIWLYHGKQCYHSKALQYVYYAFYPVHLLILGVMKFL
jgi:asparagine N-glycosylation enzyme membrane subunit Stt3